MSVESVQAEGWNDLLQDTRRVLRALDMLEPAELGDLLRSLGFEDGTRHAIGVLALLRAAGEQRYSATQLLPLLKLEHPAHEGHGLDFLVGSMSAGIKHAGAARKVSVSMPADLTAAVQQRVGRGKFSQYVADAVARQLELDLLAELSELLTAEHGPVPEEYMAEARTAWPDEE
ncbi:MAG TPA: hypothetical protein VGI74_21365 [Streptosporangiaceae bacterium]